MVSFNVQGINDFEPERKGIVSSETSTKPAVSIFTENNIDTSNIGLDEVKVNNPPPTKSEIVKKMYQKWSEVFKKSLLKESFYNKLYDVIKIMHISVTQKSPGYGSIEEQTMDEVIAVFAGESGLNPQSVSSGKYHGLFQLADTTEIKRWAAKHPEVPGMKNISQSMTIQDFHNYSGEKQLDCLIAYIGKCREYSKLKPDESITPAQLWAMIKYPFKGQTNSSITSQKRAAINKVFTENKITRGNA